MEKAAVDKLIVGHDLIDQTDAESFMGVDVIAGEGVTQGVLVPGVEHPEKVGVVAHADLGLTEDGLV